MREIEHLYLGKPAPVTRRLLSFVLSLAHAVRTGDFPYPYPLRLQPRAVQDAFQLVQIAELQNQATGSRLLTMLAQQKTL